MDQVLRQAASRFLDDYRLKGETEDTIGFFCFFPLFSLVALLSSLLSFICSQQQCLIVHLLSTAVSHRCSALNSSFLSLFCSRSGFFNNHLLHSDLILLSQNWFCLF